MESRLKPLPQRRIEQLQCFNLANQLTDHRLPVSVKHPCLIEEEQRVLDAGETRALATLDHDDVFRVIRVQDRHAVNRAGRIAARSRVDDVIRSDDQRNISSRKLRIYLVFIVNDVVGHADYCRTAFDAV